MSYLFLSFVICICNKKYKSEFENGVVKDCVRFNFVYSTSKISTGF